MSRVEDPEQWLAWLHERCPRDEAMTGYDPAGWEADTWVLHAAYERPDIAYTGTHDELEKAAVAAGLREPTVIGDVNLSLDTTASGVPLGFVTRPRAPWRRIRWAEMLGWTSNVVVNPYGPTFRWFPGDSLPATVAGPPEGSLDDASFHALVDVLAQHSAEGLDTSCLALWAIVPSWSPDGPQVWRGRLGDVHELFGDEEAERPYQFSPSNLWPEDLSWFVHTDSDMSGTHVSGDQALIRALTEHVEIEAITWRAGDPP